MSKIYYKISTNKGLSNSNSPAESKKAGCETLHDLIYQSGKLYYEYLHDMKSSGFDDDCDYCAAFMLV